MNKKETYYRYPMVDTRAQIVGAGFMASQSSESSSDPGAAAARVSQAMSRRGVSFRLSDAE